ncbi:MAG: universal stress protein [Rhizobacter sp.]|nr:universal stress protein [Bacteriovorax sp.]
MKKIVICSTLTNECIHVLKKVSKEINLSNSEVHIINIIKLQAVVIDLSPYIYPETIHFEMLKNGALTLLKEIGNSLNLQPDQIIYKSAFEYDVKESIKLYLEEVKASLVVVATREKHGIKGLFTSSTAEFLIRHSPCDVLVMKDTTQYKKPNEQ